MTFSAVHRFNQVRRFFRACRTRRADFALIGDSNIYSAGDSGLTIGFADAWGRRFGTYATGVHATNSQGSVTLDYFSAFGSVGHTVPPESHASFAFPPYGFPLDPLYYGPDATGIDFSFAFTYVNSGHPNGIAGALRWWFDYGTFATGDGQFQPVMRYDGALSYPAIGPVIPTSTGTDGITLGWLDLAAGTRSAASILGQFQVHAAGGFGGGIEPAAGPFLSLWSRWEWSGVPIGVGVSTLLYQGGLTTRNAAASMQAVGQSQFDPWCRAVVRPQGLNERPILCVQIIQGQNDGADGGGGDASSSLGPNPAPSNTPAGCADNHAAVVARLRTPWAGAGHDPDDLYFLIGPYHPQEYSRRRWSREVDEALNAYADGQTHVAVVTRSRLSSSAYFTAKGWYAGAGPDDAHLTSSAYHQWAMVAANAIVPPAVVLAQHTSGGSVDLVVFDEAGQVFDTIAGGFGPWDNAALARYIIPGVEQGTSGVYRFTLPGTLPAHSMGLNGRVTSRTGDDPSLSDTQVAMLSTGEFDGVRRALATLEHTDLEDQQSGGAGSIAADIAALSASLPDFSSLANLDAPVSHAGAGSGSTPIDHNTGGADAFRYVDHAGAGVGGATVRAYVKADYDAGNYVERGRTQTRTDGRWVSPLYLDADITYTLTLSKPGVFQLSVREVTV